MNRYFIYLKYDGSSFHGWQIQPNAHTVQAELQNALSKLEQRECDVVGAGRTDTGVHAQEMIVHFDTMLNWDKRSFIHRINSLVGKEIAVYDLRKVKPEFHARFAAIERSYVYQISFNKNPFLVNQSYLFHGKLDFFRMNEAAKNLIGEFDFSCFSKSKTQTFTNNCFIKEAYWVEENGILKFHITANRFLRNMVRAIVGTLIEVGEGKRSSDSILQLIESKNRSNAGPSVPASGLFLNSIVYPSDGFI